VLGLVGLVTKSIGGARDAVGDTVLAGDIALGLLLVGLLGSLSRVALDRLGDVVDGVLGGIDGLADDALVTGVGSRHVDWLVGWLVGW
jgi:hypothetical protein